ncbi:hypothetical protein BDF22DRAFT_747042 [Syncephalis plumigaleata]|nr:hypothetical protein BDF22DRAFT_747042 [Syncephalis plumigaleata]
MSSPLTNSTISSSTITSTTAKRRPVPSAVPQDGMIVSRRDLFGEISETTHPKVQSASTCVYPTQFKPLQWSAESTTAEEDTTSMMDCTTEEAFPLFAGPLRVVDLTMSNQDTAVQQHNRRESTPEFDADALVDRFAAVAVTAEQVLHESQQPWARHECPHKVISIPYNRRPITTTAAGQIRIRRKVRPGKLHRMRWTRRRERCRKAVAIYKAQMATRHYYSHSSHYHQHRHDHHQNTRTFSTLGRQRSHVNPSRSTTSFNGMKRGGYSARYSSNHQRSTTTTRPVRGGRGGRGRGIGFNRG